MMPALALVVAAGIAAPGALVEAALRLEGSLTSLRARSGPVAAAPATVGGGATGTLDLTLFGRRLDDDATPIALQPFLQRRLTLRASAGGGVLAPPGASGPGLATGPRAHFSLALAAPSWRRLTFDAAIAFEHCGGAADPERLTARGALGLWAGDVRVVAGVEGFAALVSFGGALAATDLRATVDLRAVVIEHIEIRTGAAANGRGVDAWLRAAYYATRRLGLHGGGFGGGHAGTARFVDGDGPLARSGRPPSGRDEAAHFGFTAGLSYWTAGGIGLAVDGAATWIAGRDESASDQRLLLRLAARE